MQWMILTALLIFLAPLLIRLRRTEGKRAERLYRRTAWAWGMLILLAMAGQEVILLLSGLLTWRTALPLHLCSLTGLIVLPALLRRDALLHALFYAGLPGAMLALLFPAVLNTPWPRLTVFFFHLMHAGLLTAPLLPLAQGWRPRPLEVVQAGGFLLMAGVAAGIANALTGGNYLFLAGPVAGTPLMWLAGRGMVVYRLALAAVATLLLAVEGVAVYLTGRIVLRMRPRK